MKSQLFSLFKILLDFSIIFIYFVVENEEQVLKTKRRIKRKSTLLENMTSTRSDALLTEKTEGEQLKVENKKSWYNSMSVCLNFSPNIN